MPVIGGLLVVEVVLVLLQIWKGVSGGHMAITVPTSSWPSSRPVAMDYVSPSTFLSPPFSLASASSFARASPKVSFTQPSNTSYSVVGDLATAADSPHPVSTIMRFISTADSLEAADSSSASGEQAFVPGKRTVSTVVIASPANQDDEQENDPVLDALYKMRLDSLESAESQESRSEEEAPSSTTRRRRKERRRKRKRKQQAGNINQGSGESSESGEGGADRGTSFPEALLFGEEASHAEAAAASSEISSAEEFAQPAEGSPTSASMEDFSTAITTSSEQPAKKKRKRRRRKKYKEGESAELKAAEPTMDLARVMDEHIRQHFNQLRGNSKDQEHQGSFSNGHTHHHDQEPELEPEQQHQDSEDSEGSHSDQHSEASKHSHNSKHAKGGGHKHNSEKHKKKGKKKKKAYKEKHVYDKMEKGFHDKEGHKKKYKDEKGKKEKHEEGAGHYGQHKKAEKGKKGAKYNEEGHHKKGHSTKGEHNVHKKDEYHKKHEFYDEHHEGGEHEKHGGFKGSHKKGEGKKYKKGHHDSAHKSKHKGKKGKHKKGKTLKFKKGHDHHEGHKGKYGHKHKYHKTSGEDQGKKWGYKKKGKTR